METSGWCMRFVTANKFQSNLNVWFGERYRRAQHESEAKASIETIIRSAVIKFLSQLLYFSIRFTLPRTVFLPSFSLNICTIPGNSWFTHRHTAVSRDFSRYQQFCPPVSKCGVMVRKSWTLNKALRTSCLYVYATNWHCDNRKVGKTRIPASGPQWLRVNRFLIEQQTFELAAFMDSNEFCHRLHGT